MLEQLLSKLPYILTIWTSVILCWGLYINSLMFKALTVPASSDAHASRLCSACCTAMANIILLCYLMFEPQLARNFGDAVIVINVFYTMFLILMSVTLPCRFKFARRTP